MPHLHFYYWNSISSVSFSVSIHPLGGALLSHSAHVLTFWLPWTVLYYKHEACLWFLYFLIPSCWSVVVFIYLLSSRFWVRSSVFKLFVFPFDHLLINQSFHSSSAFQLMISSESTWWCWLPKLYVPESPCTTAHLMDRKSITSSLPFIPSGKNRQIKPGLWWEKTYRGGVEAVREG